MDPYEVLGVPRSASDEEIRTAYRELVKKYHPDKYVDNPLADLAQEKMAEINEAYELLTKTSGHTTTVAGNTYTYGSSGNYSGQGTGYGAGSYTSGSNSKYSSHYSVREALDRNQLSRAEQLLNSDGHRDAEWYFLAGILSYKKGYYDDAMGKVMYAINMDPNNAEYKAAYQQITSTGTIYQTTSNNRGYSSGGCLEYWPCFIPIFCC